MDAGVPAEGAEDLRVEADAEVGRRPVAARVGAGRDLLLSASAGAHGALVG